MFDPVYFTRLKNETADLMQNKEKYKDVEDIDAKIESNKMALQIIAEDITDENTKQRVLSMLTKFFSTYEDDDIDLQVKKKESFLDVEKDILRGTKLLKNKAYRFYDDIKTDRQIIDKVAFNITKNISNTANTVKRINATKKRANSFNLFVYGLVLFFVVYFMIRFL